MNSSMNKACAFTKHLSDPHLLAEKVGKEDEVDMKERCMHLELIVEP